MRSVALHTLGCKLNFAETSTLARKFLEQGFKRVDFNEKANIYVINTCSVTAKADRKSKEAIKKARNQNPAAQVIVVGCYAQLQSEKIADMEGVDLILGGDEKFNILDYIETGSKKKDAEVHTCTLDEKVKYNPAFSMGDRTRSFLKIQDGCDYHCTYCTVPLARGKSRNQNIRSIVEEAHAIGKSEVKEIILTGVNIGDFGKSTGESFYELICELEMTPGIERFRISSIEPNLLSDDIIRFIAGSKKFLPHFHIPLQSGCNDMLAQMKRRYKRELFEEKINQIKKLIPGAFIGVDVIVGFPGEDDSRFLETYNFLEQMDASYYHVFSYSERPDTPAARMRGKVHAAEIKKRSFKLHQLADRKKNLFYQSCLGESREVLFEEQSQNEKVYGFTDNYIRTETQYRQELAGKTKKVLLKHIGNEGNVTCAVNP